MAAKAILVFCAQALLMQHAFAQYIGPYIGAGCGCGCAPFTPAASSGGSFVVTSSSPFAPTGVSVVSENVYEGSLVLGGNLPLLGSVALEGEFPTAGAGAVSYGCGDNAVGIVAEEGPVATGIANPAISTAAPVIGPASPAIGTFGLGYGVPFGIGFGRGYGLGYGLGFGYGLGSPFGLPYGFGLGYGAIY